MTLTPFTAAIISILLLQYFAFGLLVGMARGRTGVAAPAISGHPEFERYFRVHQNTLEQLVMVIPGIVMFSIFVHEIAAVSLGALFFVGRILYLRGYVADPAKRGAGFGLGALASVILVVGSLVGAFLQLI